jgi:hypothetical protein
MFNGQIKNQKGQVFHGLERNIHKNYKKHFSINLLIQGNLLVSQEQQIRENRLYRVKYLKDMI